MKFMINKPFLILLIASHIVIFLSIACIADDKEKLNEVMRVRSRKMILLKNPL